MDSIRGVWPSVRQVALARVVARALVGAGLILMALSGRAAATTCVMTPWSGSDGPFNVVSESGHTVDQAAGTARELLRVHVLPEACRVHVHGRQSAVRRDRLPRHERRERQHATAGNLGLQYDANATLGTPSQNAAFVINGAILNTGSSRPLSPGSTRGLQFGRERRERHAPGAERRVPVQRRPGPRQRPAHGSVHPGHRIRRALLRPYLRGRNAGRRERR